MQVHITIDMTDESLETQLEVVRKASILTKEIEKEFGAPEENAPERVEVTPKALEEHLKMEERQRERDRKAIELSEKLPRLGGLCVVEPEKYGQFLRMDWYEMSRFVKDWIDFHMDDIELTPGLVERMFKTPLNRYQRGHNLQ